jgi:replicative DNA helicase
MHKTNKGMSEALGIEYIEPEKSLPMTKSEDATELTEVVDESTSDAHADYVLSRKTFQGLIRRGEEAMDEIKDLSEQSPRSFEVYATMIKTIADVTKDLYDLQKKSKELATTVSPASKLPDGSINVERAVFVGTTTELLKQIKEQQK